MFESGGVGTASVPARTDQEVRRNLYRKCSVAERRNETSIRKLRRGQDLAFEDDAEARRR